MASDGEFESLDPDPDEFRELGYRVVDMIAEHFTQIRDIDTFSDTTPPDVADRFDDPLPQTGEDPGAVLAEWTERVYPYASHRGSPRWYGYVMGSGTPIGALADALAASVIRITGEAFVTTTEVRYNTVIRLSVCSRRTTLTDIEQTFGVLREHGERIDASDRERLTVDLPDE